MPLPSENNGIAVIITSHNYGKYLAEAIESVLSQTTPVSEIVVVDDASTDDTKEVAAQYVRHGVRYIRGEWHAPGPARNAGLRQTTSPYLVFLDADDILHSDYLRCGIDVLRCSPDTAIAYTDYQCFGERNDFHCRPETLDWEHFDAAGDLSPNSMLRRDALLQAGAWPTAQRGLEDWLLFRTIHTLGWQARKSKGMFFYRVHGDSRFFHITQRPYAEYAGVIYEQTSLLVSCSGDANQWNGIRTFLETQTFPHHLIHLLLLDYSGNSLFEEDLRMWAARSDYRIHSCLSADHIPDTDKEHMRARLLNTAIRMTTTPMIWMLSDTTNLPPNAYYTLIYRLHETVLSVALPCSGQCHPLEGHACFCCNVIRGAYMRRTILRSGPPLYQLEANFFHEVSEQNTPSSRDEPIVVVAAADENYAKGLAAMGCSLGINHKGERNIDFYILDGGITEQTKSDLLASWEQNHMRVHWITPDMSCIQHLKLTFWFTRAMYLRLLIPDLLPPSVTKAIYLDSDLLVLADIAELWNVDLGEHPIAAVQDMKFPTFDQAFKNCSTLNANPKTPYFHSGVLCMNIEQWREQGLSQKIIRFIEQFREKIQWPDQDGINAILAASCLSLDPRWNVSVQSFAHSWEQSVFDREAFANLTNNPAIVHFATQSKPWHSHCQHPKTPLFFEYLDKTLWKGWRPHVSNAALAI